MKPRILVSLCLLVAVCLPSSSFANTISPQETINNFHAALIEGDAEGLRSTLGVQVSMYNGTGSAELQDWEPHMFLHGPQVHDWAAFMTDQAGPHEVDYEILSQEERAGLVLIVTTETGQNKFMSWKDSERLYLLGMTDQGWRIVALYYPGATNPK
ncbi:MAG: hypothetical protein JJ850_18265 [Kordiimonadaceae bacterium]|nr:hypothetical protein [Kordiimonadaceae bacterium]MBO6570572.1 hypothetical protein [Kordiimonadaceae bacterium]MBO6966570.1 hypothetical protein [Kordiimonadaceae bacterium]